MGFGGSLRKAGMNLGIFMFFLENHLKRLPFAGFKWFCIFAILFTSGSVNSVIAQTSQGNLTEDYGRNHHGRCFSMWLAGGGIRPGMVHGETDDYGYNIVRDPVHVHDLNATLLHCLGFDHERLTYRYQGRDFRLTDVHGNVIKPLLA